MHFNQNEMKIKILFNIFYILTFRIYTQKYLIDLLFFSDGHEVAVVYYNRGCCPGSYKCEKVP